jgi:hypothetical protein
MTTAKLRTHRTWQHLLEPSRSVTSRARSFKLANYLEQFGATPQGAGPLMSKVRMDDLTRQTRLAPIPDRTEGSDPLKSSHRVRTEGSFDV